MKWFGRESNNVDDHRGGGGLAVGGGLGVILLVLGLIFGQDLTGLVNEIPGVNQTAAKTTDTATDAGKKFVGGVLRSTEVVWGDIFAQMGQTYSEPRLGLFSGQIQSACGSASSAVGPFYCPADNKVYIDLTFYEELSNRFGAAGDFAQAYVIAHEVGHHIQNLMGTMEKINAARANLSDKDFNKLSVKLELQADFYAGVWAHHAQKLKEFELEPGDLEEALNAASAIGDDKLQKRAQGEVVPESFTHGTSAQRTFWFKKGFDTGDINQGDTFKSTNL